MGRCIKLADCPKVLKALITVSDKDLAGDWQYAEAIRSICARCPEKEMKISAKDTVMTDSQIRSICLGEGAYWVGELSYEAAIDNPPELMPQFNRIAEAQAEKTWKARDPEIIEAGKAREKKVVDWIYRHQVKIDGFLEYSFSFEEWQEFLRSEGVE